MRVIVLYGDIFAEGNTTIIGVYPTFEKAKEAYFKAKEKGYMNIQSADVEFEKGDDYE